MKETNNKKPLTYLVGYYGAALFVSSVLLAASVCVVGIAIKFLQFLF